MARLALIAHDSKKPDIIDLVGDFRDFLADQSLVATGTTGQRIAEETGLDIDRKLSGRLGGDAQITAEIAQEQIQGVIFLRDPLTAQPHEPDISALLRICDVHDVPLATTRSGAEYILEGLDQDDGVS